MNAICLVVDRLHAGYLGAFGNTWIDTPAVDRLAAEGFVFDSMLIDSPRLDRLYRSYWHGWHALKPDEPPADRPSLVGVLRQADVATALLTDEPQLAGHPLAGEFDELLEVEPAWQAEGVDQLDQTRLAAGVVAAIDWLQSARPPFLLWCHLAALGTTWDAPQEFRRAYWEPGDPEPPESAEVPDRMLSEQFDPDELLAVTQAYSGQVTAMDACLGALAEYLRGDRAGRDTLLVLTSTRGFPLGEHRRVGPCDEALYGELVHVPLVMRFPGGLGAAGRSHALVEPADLWATLLDWWQAGPPPASPTAESLMPVVREQATVLRDRLCIGGGPGQRAIRTPAWYLLETPKPELYVKPDDRWEINDVAVRCPEVVECLQDALEQYVQTLPTGRVADLPPLGEVLREGLE
jgi:arylsulfatase A-like enzyme